MTLLRTCVAALAIGASLPALLALPARPALADQPRREPTDDERAVAADHFNQGKQALDEGKYDLAIEQFLAAAAIVPEPLLWFNAAQAYLAKGDKRMALHYFQRYLDEDPRGEGAEIARARITELEPQVAPPPPPAQAPSPAPSSTPAARKHGSRGLRLTGLVTAGAGLAGLGLGVYFGLDARGKSNDIDALFAANGGAWDPKIDALEADGRAANRNMYIAYAVGAGALLGGGVLYWIGREPSDRDEGAAAHPATTWRLTPIVSPSASALLLTGRF